MPEDDQTAAQLNLGTTDMDSNGSRIDSHPKRPERLQRSNAEPMDLLDENLHENDRSRATGFVGQSSDVQWLRSLLLLERMEGDRTSEGGAPSCAILNGQVSAVTYYLDDENIEMGVQIDPYELPSSNMAEKLLSIYMQKVQKSFPVLPRELFEDQFRTYFNALRYGLAPRLNTKWQAILNLVFAIGAKYSHLVKTSWRADEQDHVIYQARAQALAVNPSILGQHPDLLQTQVMGLLAFYYLSTGNVSR